MFIGDSITEGWIEQSPAFFTSDRINRGISGETSAQMLTRFRADVIDLHPRLVHIMAGTNDIAGLTAVISVEETEANIRSMRELAAAHGIRVIIGSITPAEKFGWRPGLETPYKIRTLNTWLRHYAKASGAIYADYWNVLHSGNAMRSDYTLDGVHPNAAGYASMAPVAEVAIQRVVNRKQGRQNLQCH